MFIAKPLSALALIVSIGAASALSLVCNPSPPATYNAACDMKRQTEVYPWTVECDYIWAPDPKFNLTAQQIQVSINNAVSVNTSANWNFEKDFLGSIGPYTNLPSHHHSTTNNSKISFHTSVYMRPDITRDEVKSYMASWTGWKIFGGFDEFDYYWTVEYDRCY